jgi:hypothetical protein
VPAGLSRTTPGAAAAGPKFLTVPADAEDPAITVSGLLKIVRSSVGIELAAQENHCSPAGFRGTWKGSLQAVKPT